MEDKYPIFHKIIFGDNLYDLARKYRTTIEDILNINPHINPYNLLIGEVLNILPGHDTVNPPPVVQEEFPQNTSINISEFNLNKKMRMLWSQHIYWNRLFIISVVDNLKDTDSTTNRLLQTAKDIANVYSPYYGLEVSNNLNRLLTEHLTIGADLVKATKKKDTVNSDRLNREWYNNADKITDSLSKINPNYNKKDLKKMFYEHLDLTKEQLSNRLSGKYEENVNTFNQVEQQALMMADYFVDGIVKQFPNEF